jgi:hypothetical protein
MQMEIYQWLVPLVGVFYISRTFIQFRKNKRSATSAAVWTVFWCTITVLAIIPNPVSFKIAGLLGFKSNINAVIFVAVGWLFLFIFYLSSTVDRLEKQITDLVRKMAIEEHEKEQKPKE